MKLLITYAASLVTLIILDLAWLGFIAKGIYAKYLGGFMRPDINWPAAIIFYILFAAGMVYFAVLPAATSGSWKLALLNGAILGFVAYMTYEMTNWAVIKDWAWQIVPIDIGWGVVIGIVVATVGYFIGNLI